MKREQANPSPIKPFLGLHEGEVRVFVSAFPLRLLGPLHYRDTPPPEPTDDPKLTLQQLERYLNK